MRTSRPDSRNGQQAAASSYLRLRALIVSGQLAPGAPLIEQDISTRLAVSRTPVRAALLRLEQEGLVCRAAAGANGRTSRGRAAARGSRAIVAPLTAADLREIFQLTGVLEATAARQAAALPAAHRTRVADALEEANRVLRDATTHRPPNLGVAHEAHMRFHRGCVDAAAGPRLRAELDALGPQAERYQRVYSVALIYALDELSAAHDAIVAAVRDGDAAAAERATAADWRLMADRQAELVAVIGERGNW